MFDHRSMHTQTHIRRYHVSLWRTECQITPMCHPMAVHAEIPSSPLWGVARRLRGAPVTDGLGTRLQLVCLSAAIGLSEEHRIASQARSKLRMLGTQCLFQNSQHPLIEEFGLGVLPLLLIQGRQVAEGSGHRGMRGTQYFLADVQGALIQWLRPGILPLGMILKCCSKISVDP